LAERVVIEARWDPILGDWVLVSNVREFRPWRPRGCPFCPGSPETGWGWRVLVIENAFPMLVPNPPTGPRSDFPFISVPGRGRCFVVVETPRHDVDDLSDLSASDLADVLETLQILFEELSKDPAIVYALWFRNKGEEVGVSLTHPHSQVYALPFIPNKVLREMRNCYRFWARSGRCLLCEVRDRELEAGERVVCRTRFFAAFVPFWAKWPFEIHVHPLRHLESLRYASREELEDLARCLRAVLQGLRRVFGKPMPYVAVLHEPPLRGSYPWFHTHLEIYGMYRVSGRLKYAGGSETGGGVFTYDSTPEVAAKMLRSALEVPDHGSEDKR